MEISLKWSFLGDFHQLFKTQHLENLSELGLEYFQG